MKKYSLRTKIVAASIVLFIFISILGSMIIRDRIGDIVMERMEKESIIIMDNTRISLLHLFEHDDTHIIEEIVQSFTTHDLIDNFRVCTKELQVVYSSDKTQVGEVTNNMCISAVASKDMEVAAHFDVQDDVFEIAMPITNEYVDGILYAHLDNDYIHRILDESTSKVLRIFTVSNVVVMFLILLMVTYFILKPIAIIKASTERVIGNDYDTKIEIKSKDEFEELAIAYNHMIDSIKKQSQDLKNSKLQAEEAAEKRLSFLAHMSHEIRTPLNSIIGFTDILLERKSCTEDKKELKIIMNSCNHLLQVINEIIDISKYEQGSLEFEEKPYSIRQLIYEVDGMFGIHSVNGEIEYTSAVEPEVPDFFIGDAYRIKEVIINMISNALKFTSDGYVSVKVWYDELELFVSVEDSGIGIPLDKQETIFDAFTQSDESTTRVYGGSGLGLAISKKIITHMGGDFNVYSDGIKGTTFTIRLTPKLYIDDRLSSEKRGQLMVERWLATDSLVRDIALEYIPDMIRQIKELERIYMNGDTNTLEEAIHKLKGTTGHFKMNEIHECLKEFESYLRESDAPHIDGPIYIKELDNFVAQIPPTFNQRSSHVESVEAIKSPSENSVDTSRGIRLLLADDVLENRLLIRKMLERENVEIDTASNGEEVIEALKENYYDCLLLDIQMPIVSGEEVLQWIKEQPEKIVGHIITLTANARAEEMSNYIELGSDDYLAKPVNKEMLRNKIKALTTYL